jgi:hypothetical protein
MMRVMGYSAPKDRIQPPKKENGVGGPPLELLTDYGQPIGVLLFPELTSSSAKDWEIVWYYDQLESRRILRLVVREPFQLPGLSSLEGVPSQSFTTTMTQVRRDALRSHPESVVVERKKLLPFNGPMELPTILIYKHLEKALRQIMTDVLRDYLNLPSDMSKELLMSFQKWQPLRLPHCLISISVESLKDTPSFRITTELSGPQQMPQMSFCYTLPLWQSRQR